jgi:hypothetical protein
MTRSFKKPFSINQIVKAKVSYRPAVVAGDFYRVKQVSPAMSYSGWMVGVAALGRSKALKGAPVVETLDAGYFAIPHGAPGAVLSAQTH